MKIRITSPRSIYGKNGEDMFDKVINVAGDVPKGWHGKYQVVKEKPADDAALTTGDKKSDSKDGKK